MYDLQEIIWRCFDKGIFGAPDFKVGLWQRRIMGLYSMQLLLAVLFAAAGIQSKWQFLFCETKLLQ